MILGFKPIFVEKILNKSKVHSIREDKGNRWKTGRKIHFATGVRTKNYKQFKCEDFCKSTQKIFIFWYDFEPDHINNIFLYTTSKRSAKVIIGDKMLDKHEMAQLAKNDGFDTVHDFFKWFNKEQKGQIIHWTDLQY